MSQSVEVVVSELHSAASRLRDAGQRLQDGLSGVDLETSQMLGSGWKSDAASAFGTAWDQWHSGAGQVVRGLQTMADLLTVAGKEYAKTDEQSAGAVSSSFDGGGGSTTGGAPSTGAGPTGPAGLTGSGGPGGPGGGDAAGQLASQLTQAASQAGESVGQVPGQLAQSLGQAGQTIAGLVTQAVQAGGDAASADEDERKDPDHEDDSDSDGERPARRTVEKLCQRTLGVSGGPGRGEDGGLRAGHPRTRKH
ncbi:WXG100 family type VII secretion target [Mycobacterium sp. NPDC003449]